MIFKRISKAIFLLSCLIVSCGQAQSQVNAGLQETYFEAEYFLMNGDYQDALIYYKRIYDAMPQNSQIAYRIGLCCLNIEGRKREAVDYLEKAVLNLSSRFREGVLKQVQAPYDALLYLGDAYRINYMFTKAKNAYEKYRATLLPDDIENMAFVDQQIADCINAPALMARPVKYTVESISNIINDSKKNFFPVVSSDGKSIAYMSGMKFYDAIMFTRMIQGQWIPPVNITPELQSDGDQYVSCLSASGGHLLISKDDNYNSDIWISNFDGVRWEPARRLKKGINTKYWESHGYLSDDETVLIFASDRPGGYGGLDLYISRADKNGEWEEPVNLGPEINTPLNEDRPFLANNGKMLFFASQGHYNMGGYDIFYSCLDNDGKWGNPVNLGYPLNTPDDNIFFCPSDNGKGGYISMIKDNEGAGKDDIYKIRFK